ncbi:MAG: hypothetical protein SXA11_20515, partial [Cyanobacteriota bacterium]|nr:hypothetical protein [Cyanobacteriota bacterium]
MATSLPVAANHTRAVLSQLAVARYLPSRLKATAHTQSSWLTLATSLPVAANHTPAVLSQLAVARYLPSGLKATA